MSGSPAARTSRLMTVRLDSVTRDRLDEVALHSDRSLAQLVRYALVAYFELSPTPVLVRDDADDAVMPRHMAVRIPDALAEQVDGRATVGAVSASEVIRCAIGVWLATADRAVLGSPAGSEVTR